MSSTALKLTALVFMTADHIGRFIPGAPFFLRIIGRIAMPVFLFCSMWGFDLTSDRRKYMTRLYLFSVVTGGVNFVLNTLYPYPYYPANGNILSTIFIITFYIWRIESGEKSKLIFGGVNLVGFALHYILLRTAGENAVRFTDALRPSFFTCEGGTAVFIMGLLFYYSKQDKNLLKRNYLCYCAVYLAIILFATSPAVTGTYMSLFTVLFKNYIQWLQVLALPFILMYNGCRGADMKWLFYIYYPLHTAVLFMLGNIMLN